MDGDTIVTKEMLSSQPTECHFTIDAWHCPDGSRCATALTYLNNAVAGLDYLPARG